MSVIWKKTHIDLESLFLAPADVRGKINHKKSAHPLVLQ